MNEIVFGYIYKFTDIISNKIYIGKREKKVFDEYYYGSGKLWRQVVKQVGKQNIKREILEWCYSREQLCQREIFWIKEFNSTDRNIGYNIHKGGAGGNSLNDTEAWSYLHRGEKNGRFGKEVSEITREKISKANSGKIRTEEFKKKLSLKTKGQKKPNGFGEKISKAQKGRKKTELELQHLREACKTRSEKLKGNKIYNNGIIEIRIMSGDQIPDGFIKGRKSQKARVKQPTAGLHWYTNGVDTVYCKECPDGYMPGRKLK